MGKAHTRSVVLQYKVHILLNITLQKVATGLKGLKLAHTEVRRARRLLQRHPNMLRDRFNLTVTAKKRFSEQPHSRTDRLEAAGPPGAVAAYALVGLLVCSRWADRSCGLHVDDTE